MCFGDEGTVVIPQTAREMYGAVEGSDVSDLPQGNSIQLFVDSSSGFLYIANQSGIFFVNPNYFSRSSTFLTVASLVEDSSVTQYVPYNLANGNVDDSAPADDEAGLRADLDAAFASQGITSPEDRDIVYAVVNDIVHRLHDVVGSTAAAVSQEFRRGEASYGRLVTAVAEIIYLLSDFATQSEANGKIVNRVFTPLVADAARNLTLKERLLRSF